MITLKGSELWKFAKAKTSNFEYEERTLVKDLHNYMMAEPNGSVCCLYGLRRTGKTVMIAQEIARLNDLDNCLFLQCENGDCVQDIKNILDKETSFKYVFIDEATKAEDFLRVASVFSDMYAMSRKIVFSSTDSLGLNFTSHTELFGRCVTIHTTYIPFKEFNRLLGKGIEDYIKYGGTLTPETVCYNNDLLHNYSNTAIVFNIVNSLLKCDHFHNEGYFVLENMIEHNELPSFINKVIEYPTREFVANIMNKPFKSNDLGSLSDLLERKTLVDPTLIHTKEMSNRIRAFLMIKEKPFTMADEQSANIITSYLKDLDVLYQIPEFCYLGPHKSPEFIFTQPGMRYCQATGMVKALITSEEYQMYTPTEKAKILEKLDEDICGKLLEEIIYYQLSSQFVSNSQSSDYMVAKYCNRNGEEIDALVIDLANKSMIAIEVKWTSNISEEQIRHLVSQPFCEEVEGVAGAKITNKLVVYRGETGEFKDVLYLNAEDFLKDSVILISKLLSTCYSSTKDLYFDTGLNDGHEENDYPGLD